MSSLRARQGQGAAVSFLNKYSLQSAACWLLGLAAGRDLLLQLSCLVWQSHPAFRLLSINMLMSPLARHQHSVQSAGAYIVLPLTPTPFPSCPALFLNLSTPVWCSWDLRGAERHGQALPQERWRAALGLHPPEGQAGVPGGPLGGGPPPTDPAHRGLGRDRHELHAGGRAGPLHPHRCRPHVSRVSPHAAPASSLVLSR